MERLVEHYEARIGGRTRSVESLQGHQLVRCARRKEIGPVVVVSLLCEERGLTLGISARPNFLVLVVLLNDQNGGPCLLDVAVLRSGSSVPVSHWLHCTLLGMAVRKEVRSLRCRQRPQVLFMCSALHEMPFGRFR